MKISFWIIAALIMPFLLSSCMPVAITAMPTITGTQITVPNTISPSNTFALNETGTPLPAPSLTPTLSPTRTPTAPPQPTLAPEQARKIIMTVLQEPVDCAAPCFWGIIPGKTELGEANDILTHLGLEIKSTTLDNKDFYGFKYDFDSGLSVITTLTVTKDIVRNLRVDIGPEKQVVGVKREWLAYSPETLINRYGRPSSVVFALDWGPRSFFDMVMYFDAVDLIVEYSGYDIIHKEKGSPRICPLTAQFEAVNLWMGKDPVYPPGGGVPLEEATGMTMEEFSKVITGDPDKACFELNGEMSP